MRSTTRHSTRCGCSRSSDEQTLPRAFPHAPPSTLPSTLPPLQSTPPPARSTMRHSTGEAVVVRTSSPSRAPFHTPLHPPTFAHTHSPLPPSTRPHSPYIHPPTYPDCPPGAAVVRTSSPFRAPLNPPVHPPTLSLPPPSHPPHAPPLHTPIHPTFTQPRTPIAPQVRLALAAVVSGPLAAYSFERDGFDLVQVEGAGGEDPAAAV